MFVPPVREFTEWLYETAGPSTLSVLERDDRHLVIQGFFRREPPVAKKKEKKKKKKR